MNKKHLKLLKKLARLFLTTKAHSSGGELIYEQGVMLTGIHLCRPDLAYFSSEQIDNSYSPDSEEPIPEFVIEVISTTDQLTAVRAKLKQYFQNGVKVAWLIYPDDKLVGVYSGFKTVQICSDKDICSAKPVFADYEIAAEDLLG